MPVEAVLPATERIAAYAQLVEREQARVASVLADRATLSLRGLSPDAVRFEHEPDAIADNLLFDGRGWRLHMHLAPFGNGLLFLLDVENGAIRDLAAPMAEPFPVRTWRPTIFVDLAEMAEAGRVAPDVVAGLTDAARRLAVHDGRRRAALERKAARPPEALERLVAFPVLCAGAPRSLTTLNPSAPVPRDADCVIRLEVEGVPYRSEPPVARALGRPGPFARSQLPRLLARLGADASAFAHALAPPEVCWSEDPASRCAFRIGLGAGVFGEASRADAVFAIRGRAIAPALERIVGGPAATALLARLRGEPRGRDDEGRALYRAVDGTAEDARPLPGILGDADAWIASAPETAQAPSGSSSDA